MEEDCKGKRPPPKPREPKAYGPIIIPAINSPKTDGIPRLDASFPKILTAKTIFSDDFEKSDFVFSGPEFFIYQLTGAAVTILPETPVR